MSDYSVDPKWKKIHALVQRMDLLRRSAGTTIEEAAAKTMVSYQRDRSMGIDHETAMEHSIGNQKMVIDLQRHMAGDPEMTEDEIADLRQRVEKLALSDNPAGSASPEAMEAWVERNRIWRAMQEYARQQKKNHPDYWQLEEMFKEKSPLADQVGPPTVAGMDVDAAGYKDLALLPMLMMNPSTTSPAEPAEQVQEQFPTGWENYESEVSAAAAKYEVPLDMFWRLLKTENDIGNPNAKNPSSGATGLAQFMPATAAEMGIDPKNPHQSIDASAKYLRALNRQFGNWEDAVAAYNWGPSNVKKYLADGGDMPEETQNYLNSIQPEQS